MAFATAGPSSHTCKCDLLDVMEGEGCEVHLWCPQCDLYFRTGLIQPRRGAPIGLRTLKKAAETWYANAAANPGHAKAVAVAVIEYTAPPGIDDTDRRTRPVEVQALRNVEQYLRAVETAGKKLDLPNLMLRIVKLERAALRYHGKLNHDERIEFIQVNLMDQGTYFSSKQLKFAMPAAMSRLEIEGYLARADDIIASRERLRLPTHIDDFSEVQVGYLYRRFLNAPRVKQRQSAKQAA